ncbi:MAG: heavy metal translocating P-type ATPase metal-binding domain-containing protein [Bacteroidetes bacterium]|nr:heavy metal translocating P-type ATPase metal-binding domain-containing protein [Bacteroidota bacterium]
MSKPQTRKITEKAEHPARSSEEQLCFHCGTPCLGAHFSFEEKQFCCDGCKLVYEILSSKGLCNYYELEQHPGLTQIRPLRTEKFAYLDNEAIAVKLCSFRTAEYSIVTLYLPGVHCASCLWLLEHLSQVNPAITQSRLSFSTKELSVHFRHEGMSLGQLAALLSTIGYEPYISLDDADRKRVSNHTFDRARIARLGVAGFCFGNIMMLAFPEYFGGGDIGLRFTQLFRWLSVALSIPVFFYCASEFFVNAWSSLRQIFSTQRRGAALFNIDAPIALAILITFIRSLYEIFSGTGSGYLDSMSGIVFFMLVGRVVQERTFRSLSFHRDYKAYFPIAVTVQTESGKCSRSLHDLKAGDQVLISNEEIIPADGTMLEGEARIDYSFVTGESEQVLLHPGQKVYAGGRQKGAQMLMLVEKPVAGSYLSSLWNNHAFSKNKQEEAYSRSSVHRISIWFTVVLFTLAAVTTVWWAIHDPSKMIPAVSTMLIVACPCALLLCASFTQGSLMRLFSEHGLFLRDATVIEKLSSVSHVVFDKTGTLTTGSMLRPEPGTAPFSTEEKIWVAAIVTRSNHPRSRALAEYLGPQEHANVLNWEHVAGAGVRAIVRGRRVLVGNALFCGSPKSAELVVRIDGSFFYFQEVPCLREGLPEMLRRLKPRFSLSLISGDGFRHFSSMRQLFGSSQLHFQQRPEEKLHYVESLQHQGEHVLMIGDGLNDAGALQQSDTGITLAEDVNNFTPSCDAILDSRQLSQLPALLTMARWGGYLIHFAFGLSLLYNFVGLYFAMRAEMHPLIAAILMPASTLSIVLVSVGFSAMLGRWILKPDTATSRRDTVRKAIKV